MFFALSVALHSKNQMGFCVVNLTYAGVRAPSKIIQVQKNLQFSLHDWLHSGRAMSGTSFKKFIQQRCWKTRDLNLIFPTHTQNAMREEIFYILMMLEINFWNLLCKKYIQIVFKREAEKYSSGY